MASALVSLHSHWRAALLVGLAGGLLLAVWGLLAPAPLIGAGWLVGFLFWLCIAVGALLLLAIHALTSGRWGYIALPALRPAAATMPAFVVLVLPILLSLSALFPWANGLGPRPDDVAAGYLNMPGWSLRGLGALLVWTVIEALLLRGYEPRRPVAAIGLCLHGVLIPLIGIDWILSVGGHFYSTAFGAAFSSLQILAALAWIAIAAVVPRGGAGKAGDIGGLMIAAALGSLYLGFSQYLVVWYGNMPERVSWYVDRQHGAWLWIDLLAIMLSGVLPVFVLMRQSWRDSPRVLAGVGYGVLLGVFAHLVWLIAPPFGPLTILAALLATVAIGGFWLALAGLRAPARPDDSRAV